jgi:cell division protein FtsB
MSKKAKIAIAITYILTFLLFLFGCISAPALETDFFGPLLSIGFMLICCPPFIIYSIILVFVLIMNAVSKIIMRKTHQKYSSFTIKSLVALFMIVVIFLVGSIFVVMDIKRQEAKQNEKYIESTQAQKTIIEQIKLDPEGDGVENIERAFDVIKKDNEMFLKNAPRSENNEEPYCWLEDEEIISCSYSTYFDMNNAYDYNYKQVLCEYYYPNTSWANAGKIIYTTEYTFRDGNIKNINIDFIIRDIENTFGQLKDKEAFRKAIEKTVNRISEIEKKKKVDATYDDDLGDDITVKTSSGATIAIGNISNYQLTIKGEYTVDIPQKENIYNVPPIEEAQENTCRVPNCKTCS